MPQDILKERKSYGMLRGLSPVSSEDKALLSQALTIPANLNDGQGEIVNRATLISSFVFTSRFANFDEYNLLLVGD